MQPTSRSSSHTLPWPLVQTEWLASHLTDPDLRILDCAIVLELEDGVPRMTSGIQAWRNSHIPGSQYVDVLEELCDARQAIPMSTLP
jgi:thiosulfate/3-mercaptopyruvate sulfurtransferase